MAPTSRDVALDAGMRLFLEGGYAATGLKAVLDEAGIPKGSFYHYFPSKRAFAIEAAEQYFEAHLAAEGRHLSADDESAQDRSPLDRLHVYFEALADAQAERGFTGGCLLGGFAQEVAGQDERFRQALDALFERWRALLAGVLADAQTAGEVTSDVEADVLASYVLSAWEGALVQMKAQCSRAPLDMFLNVTFSALLRA